MCCLLADRQTSAANSRCCRRPRRRSGGDSARRETRATTESELGGRCASGRQRRDGQLVHRVIEDEFQAAGVTAIHPSRLGEVAVVSNWRLAGRTLPRHVASLCGNAMVGVSHIAHTGVRFANRMMTMPSSYARLVEGFQTDHTSVHEVTAGPAGR